MAEEPGQITVRQSRFLSTGDVEPIEDESVWWIPLGLKMNNENSGPSKKALTSKVEVLRDIDETFYKLNHDMNGFYRTNYPAERLIKLGKTRSRLPIQDRIGLVGDAAALAVAGDGTTAALLALCAEFKEEKDMLSVKNTPEGNEL